MTTKMISPQLLRFCTVGVIITAVDFCAFLALRNIGLTILVANIISTSIALSCSLLLHRKYTFKLENRLPLKAKAVYIAITLTGIWALQPAIMYALVNLYALPHGAIASLLPKIAATAASTVWNYVLYKKLVFQSFQPSQPSGPSAK